MSWRKWFVRGLVFSVAGVCACAAYLYRYWTNPAVVRQQVIALFAKHFPGAVITVDGAHMSLFGGIVLSDLHFFRRDDAEQVEFLHIPSANILLDKEQLLDGKPSIRKMEVDHLRLRLARGRDGQWNLAGVCKLSEPDVPVPTLVVHQSTLILEDHFEAAGLPGIEINNVDITFVNDPLPIVQMDGRGRSEVLGDLEIHGTRNRRTGDISLSIQAQGVPVRPALLQRLARRCPAGSLDGLRLEGQADILANIAYTPGNSPALGYDVNCRLTNGRLSHTSVPIPLENLDARLRCHDGQLRLEELKATSGSAEVWARGSGLLPCPDCNCEGVLEIKHLQLQPGLFEKLPPQFQKLNEQFQPRGPTTIRIACARRDGSWAKLPSGSDSTVSLQPEDIKASFYNFPYTLDRVGGVLTFNLATRRIHVDVVGFAGAQPVFIRGYWQGKGEQADAALDIQASDISLDDKLLGALRRSSFYELARSFHARGKGDIKALVRHVPGIKTFANEYHVQFHDADIQWEHFPLFLSSVSGILDIYPHYIDFYNFAGRHKEGTVLVSGRTTPDPDPEGKKPRLHVHIVGKNLELNADVKHAMEAHPMLLKTWESFSPSGRSDFTARIDRLKGPATEAEVLRDMHVQVEMRGATITPPAFPYALAALATRFRYHQNKVELLELSARHGGTQVSVGPSTIDLHPAGGFYADLKQLQARDLTVEEDFIKALPPSLAGACRSVALQDPVQIQTDLIVGVAAEPGTPPDIYWDGQTWLRNARFRAGLDLTDVTGIIACRGRHWRDNKRGELLALNGNFRLEQATMLKQPFHDVQANFHVHDSAPDALLFGLRVPLFGGDISGQVRLEMNSSSRYMVNLTASQIDLGEFGRYNLGDDSKLRGRAGGRLVLSGVGADVKSLDGNGQIEIPRGHIYPYKVPLLIDLIKLLGLRAPDRTMFDEANAAFKISGERVHLEKLELLGTAVSLYGHGDFKLDGTDVKVDFYPSWGRVEQLMPEVLRSIPAEIGKKMLKIEMRGKLGANRNDLKLTKKPVPILVDPLLYVRDKVVGGK